MNSFVGTQDWMAPEADVFALGAMFLAILQRDSVVFNGKAFYGAYWCIPGVGKVGLGRAMTM